MSPFAGYPDFKACVAENQDKDSPEGFCAWLEKKGTGKHSDHLTLGLPDDVSAAYWAAFDQSMEGKSDELAALKAADSSVAGKGWTRKKQGWMRQADNQQIQTTSVYGLPVFAVGTHNGDKYTRQDLAEMLVAFRELKGRINPAVKIGHTTDEFNQTLAKKMGIRPEFIEGENGNGAMAFGWIDNIRMQDNVLYADLTDVPVPVAEMIKSKSYKPVSCEVVFGLKDRGKTYPKVITGLALLGAEIPAVKEAGLEKAAVYVGTEQPSVSIEFNEGGGAGNLEEVVMADYPWDKCISDQMDRYGDMETAKKVCATIRQKSQGLSSEDLPILLSAVESKLGVRPKDKSSKNKEDGMQKEIYAELGIAETATDADVLTAVKKLKDAALFKSIKAALGLADTATTQDVEGAIATLKQKVTTGDVAAVAKFADLETKVGSLTTQLKAEQRKGKVAIYVQQFAELKAISGKPADLAEEVVALEEKDPELAKKHMARFTEMNLSLVAAGIFKSKGTPAGGGDGGEEHPFITKVKKYAQENGMTEAKATTEMRKSDPAGWKAYRLASREAAGTAVDNSDKDGD